MIEPPNCLPSFSPSTLLWGQVRAAQKCPTNGFQPITHVTHTCPRSNLSHNYPTSPTLPFTFFHIFPNTPPTSSSPDLHNHNSNPHIFLCAGVVHTSLFTHGSSPNMDTPLIWIIWVIYHGVEPHVPLTAPVNGHISGTTGPNRTNEGPLESWRRVVC